MLVKPGNTLTVCILSFQWRQRMCLELYTDGFNFFESFAASYSYWPVILMIYNLPLRICIRPKFMFLSMVIPDPNTPGWNIDVCLWPLINELKQLCSFKTLSYDVSRKQKFLMMTALIWTINDFLDLWNGFWLEHIWKINMSILYEK